MKDTAEEFENFFNIIKRLRAPGGCPWDIEQTPLSMRTALLEETYEAIEAINEDGYKNAGAAHVKEELGDVILNALMISYMYEQAGIFSSAQMFAEVSEKLIRRHPHVFGQTEGFEGKDSAYKAATSEDVLNQWEKIKDTVEKRGESVSVLDSVSKEFPPMLKALKIQKKVSKTGFDWESAEGSMEKIDEELCEFREAVNSGDKERIEDELGDIFFALINTACLLDVNPELAMQRTNKKFEMRFKYIERKMKECGLKLCRENLEKMEEFWQQAKKEKL